MKDSSEGHRGRPSLLHVKVELNAEAAEIRSWERRFMRTSFPENKLNRAGCGPGRFRKECQGRKTVGHRSHLAAAGVSASFGGLRHCQEECQVSIGC